MATVDSQQRMKIPDVVGYLKEVHGITKSKKTVYNWVCKGVRGTKLATVPGGGWSYTTPALVDEFLNTVHQQRYPDQPRPQVELTAAAAAARKKLQETGFGVAPDGTNQE